MRTTATVSATLLALALAGAEPAVSVSPELAPALAAGSDGPATVAAMTGYHPLSGREIACSIDAPGEVRLRLRDSALLPIRAGASYGVNRSDQPAQWLRADADGTLVVPIRPHAGYCSVLIAAGDDTDLLAGAPWRSRADAKEGRPCGEAGADPAAAGCDGRPAWVLRKHATDGSLALAAGEVAVVDGRDYLIQGAYRFAAPVFGSRPRLVAVLRGEGLPERTIADPGLHFFAAPLYGEPWRPVQVRVAVPAGYRSLAVELRLDGAPQAMWWSGLSLREAPPPLQLPPRPRPAEDARAAVSVEDVRRTWEGRSPRQVEVAAPDGLTRLTVDGRVQALLAYNHYVKPARAVEVGAMAAAGIRWQFACVAPYPRQWWLGRGRYDFSHVQEAVETVLAHDPQALVMLTASVTPRFAAWADEHPDGVWRDEQGRTVGYRVGAGWRQLDSLGEGGFWFPSLASDAYRDSASEAVAALAAHLATFPAGRAVAGLMLWGGNDNQWQRPLGSQFEGLDHSAGALADFRRHLARQYGGDGEALRAAWGDPAAGFATAVFPTAAMHASPRWLLDPAQPHDRRVIDQLRHADAGLATTLGAIARTFKQALGRPALVMTYLHDQMEFGGRSCHAQVFAEGAIDGLVGIPSYQTWRSAGAPGQITGALRSYGLHGRIRLLEQDLRTHVAEVGRDAYAGNHHLFGGARDEREFGHLARRDAAAHLTRGTGAWFLCMPGTMFTTPGYRAHVAAISRVAAIVAERPRPRETGQMAVYVDQDGETAARPAYGRAFSSMSVIHPVRDALARSGVPFDPYFLSDLDHPRRPGYRVHLFLSAPTISAARVAWVEANLQRDGNVIVVANAAGAAGAAGPFPETVRRLCGIRAALDQTVVGAWRTVPAASADRFARALADDCELLWDQPLARVDDPAAEAVGRIAGTPHAGWAVRRFPTWTGVYVALAGAITPSLVRAAVREAGLEPVGPEGDVTFQGNGLLAIHALSAGRKRLHLPAAAALTDLDDGTARPAAAVADLPMQAGETRWFRCDD